MQQEITAENYDDDNGNPAGGFVEGVGLLITWQDGPLGRGNERIAPNGAFVETVIAAVVQRIEYYQRSKFNSSENADALMHLYAALAELNMRTKRREARAVEGTHAV